MFLNLIGACYGNQNRRCTKVGIFHMAVGTIISSSAFLVVIAFLTLRQIVIDDGTFIILFQFIHIQISLTFVHAFFMLIMKRRLNNNNYKSIQ